MAVSLLALVGFALVGCALWLARRPVAEAAKTPDPSELLARETLAIITRSLGHDFGNMMAAMGMSLSLAKLKVERKHDGVAQALDEAELACERATKLAKQIMAFSRGEKNGRRVTALNDLLQIIAQVCVYNSSAPIEVSANPALYPVECDDAQLALVFHALIMTAVRGNANGRRVPVVADNWSEPGSGQRFARISVQHGSSEGSASPPAFDLLHAEPLIVAHKGRIVREHDSEGDRLILLLPSAGTIG